MTESSIQSANDSTVKQDTTDCVNGFKPIEECDLDPQELFTNTNFGESAIKKTDSNQSDSERPSVTLHGFESGSPPLYTLRYITISDIKYLRISIPTEQFQHADLKVWKCRCRLHVFGRKEVNRTGCRSASYLFKTLNLPENYILSKPILIQAFDEPEGSRIVALVPIACYV